MLRKCGFQLDAERLSAVCDVLVSAFGTDPWPAPLKKITGDSGRLRDLIAAAAGATTDAEGEITKNGRMLGSLILGESAERVFESRYRSKLATTEIQLVDQRESRNDTDYRLVNGRGRPLYRLNIKFHGALFRNAKDLVGLEPVDCFPLATYKIKSALDKQDQEHLPYIFVVATGSQISAERIAMEIPSEFIAAATFGKAAISSGKRRLEEQIASKFVSSQPERFAAVENAIDQAQWYVFSARRAEEIMKTRLFERVYALRMRSFNRAYRNAEIDMHLSFAADMIPLERFLEMIAKEGHFKLAGMLERGTI